MGRFLPRGSLVRVGVVDHRGGCLDDRCRNILERSVALWDLLQGVWAHFTRWVPVIGSLDYLGRLALGHWQNDAAVGLGRPAEEGIFHHVVQEGLYSDVVGFEVHLRVKLE